MYHLLHKELSFPAQRMCICEFHVILAYLLMYLISINQFAFETERQCFTVR
jgi:hypothetical protein